jgi:Nif-specific regulatory protein
MLLRDEDFMTASILGVAGPFENFTFTLEEELTIGRDPANRVSLLDYALSRRHCVIVHDNGSFIVRDLGSHNGTMVNGAAVEEKVLEEGDRIAVGSSVFQFTFGTSDRIPNPATVSFEELSEDLQTDVAGDSSFCEEALLASSLSRERLARDYAALLAITTRLRGIRSSESLMWQLVGAVLEVIPAERVAILIGDDSNSLQPTFAWDRISGPGQPVRVSRTIVQRTMKEKAPVLMNDVPQRLQTDSVKELQVRSVLCVPMCTPEKLLGVIYTDGRQLGSLFDAGHLHLMTAVATSATLAFENTKAIEALEAENRRLKAEVKIQFDMIGDSRPMQDLFRFIAKAAPSEANVLIYGESGTGKELVARALHRHSHRAEKAFVAINCAAITESLLESELFGHEKGAFTGAAAQKRGYLEVADQGTIFLDEIGELALPLQAKLLRVLQERELTRVGSTQPIKVNIRVVAATNKDLKQLSKQGAFREDLYYRLNVVSFHLDPLRNRRDDIPVLAQYFVTKYAAKSNRQIEGISEDALSCLANYDWPGNVRELENVIERAVVLGSTRNILRDDLPESLTESMPTAAADYHSEVARRKKELVLQALNESEGNFTEAAKRLGVHPNYLHRLVRVLDLRSELKKSAGE